MTQQRSSEELDRTEKPKGRKTLTESEFLEFNRSEVEELGQTDMGHVGPKDYYKSSSRLLYMARPDAEAAIHDAETQHLIEETLIEIEKIREQIDEDKTSLEQLKNETRTMIARLLIA